MQHPIRKIFAIVSIIMGGLAVGVPDGVMLDVIPLSKMLISISTALNAVNLYLLKEEEHEETETP